LLTLMGGRWQRQAEAGVSGNGRFGGRLPRWRARRQLLLNARDEDGSRMTDRQLRDEAMTIVLAGHETTALALSWAWYLVSQHAAVHARLFAEVDSVLGDRAPVVADAAKLKYAEAVILESMRLFPPIYGIDRLKCSRLTRVTRSRTA
jgi:cytochrome P450